MRWFILMALVANFSWADSHVFYTCESDDSPLAFSFHFNREWPNPMGAYTSRAIIGLPDMSMYGTVTNSMITEQSRLYGYTRVVVSTQNGFSLTLMENPQGTNAFGAGTLMGQGMMLSCSVAVGYNEHFDG